MTDARASCADSTAASTFGAKVDGGCVRTCLAPGRLTGRTPRSERGDPITGGAPSGSPPCGRLSDIFRSAAYAGRGLPAARSADGRAGDDGSKRSRRGESDPDGPAGEPEPRPKRRCQITVTRVCRPAEQTAANPIFAIVRKVGVRHRLLGKRQLRRSGIHVTVAQRVERSSETRGVAGSIPAGHISGFVAQPEESPPLKRCGAGSTPAGAIGKDCQRRGTPFRKRLGLRALRVRLPLLPLEGSFRCSRAVRRATVNREAQVRSLPPELRYFRPGDRPRGPAEPGFARREPRARGAMAVPLEEGLTGNLVGSPVLRGAGSIPAAGATCPRGRTA